MHTRHFILIIIFCNLSVLTIAQNTGQLSDEQRKALDKAAAEKPAVTSTQAPKYIDQSHPEVIADRQAAEKPVVVVEESAPPEPTLPDEVLAAQESQVAPQESGLPGGSDNMHGGEAFSARSNPQPPGEMHDGKILNRRTLTGEDSQPAGLTPDKILNRRTLRGPDTQPEGDQKKPNRVMQQVRKNNSEN